MSVIALIPARGGSKRIPRKNVLSFCGKPMIAWSIGTAKASGLFDAVVVSTDDDEIRRVAIQHGAEVPFQRPAEYADEHSGIRDVIVQGIQAMAGLGRKPDVVCCLFATAPMVRVADLRRGKDLLLSSGAHFAYSVTKYRYPLERALRIRPDGRIEMRQPEHRLTRSQELEDFYHDAAQFYWGLADSFLDRSKWIPHPHSVPVILPPERVQDIDHMEDWRRAEWMFRAMQAETIETERLILRPMGEEDAPYVVAWRSAGTPAHAFLNSKPVTLESHLAWFRGPRPNRIDYVIERKTDGMPVGTLHFKNIDCEKGTAESGRLIGDPVMRGQGLGRESAVAWLRHGFVELGLKEIHGITSVDNESNIALNRSLGYVVAEGGGAPGGFVRMVLTKERARESGWLAP